MDIIIFLQYYVIFRPTKIINNLTTSSKIEQFWFLFSVLKISRIFFFFSLKNVWLGDQILSLKKTVIFKIFYFLKMCPIFVCSLEILAGSDDEKMMISTRCIWLCGFMVNLQKNLEQILTPSSFTNFPGNILTNFKIVGFQHNVEITHVGTGTNSSQTMFWFLAEKWNILSELRFLENILKSLN